MKSQNRCLLWRHYKYKNTHLINALCLSSGQKFANPCHAEEIMLPHPLLIFSQSDYLIQIVAINSHTEQQTVQIQISWLLQKPTDLDLHCLQMQGISGLSRIRVKILLEETALITHSTNTDSAQPVCMVCLQVHADKGQDQHICSLIRNCLCWGFTAQSTQ